MAHGLLQTIPGIDEIGAAMILIEIGDDMSRFGCSIQLPLESESLLLMKGDTQRNWKHGIAEATKPLGVRVNLTFRQIQ